MQLDRSTKLLLPLLGICGALWIFSNFCVASLAIRWGVICTVVALIWLAFWVWHRRKRGPLAFGVAAKHEEDARR